MSTPTDNEPFVPPEPFRLGRFQFDVWQQWTEWFTGRFNWKNFALIEVSYEWELYCHGHEFQLSLLGFCLRITYWYGEIGKV